MEVIIIHVRWSLKIINGIDDAYETGKNNYDFFKFQTQATAS